MSAADRVSRSSPAASRGIGRATVVALARAGSSRRVLLRQRRSRRARDASRPSKPSAARSSRCRPTSPTPTPSTARSPRSRAALGPVHVLVNNAGINRDGLLVRMTDEQWQAVLDTNLTGAFHTIRRATPGDDEGALRPDRQRLVGRRAPRHRRAGQLRRGQGRPRRAHAQRRPRARPPAASPATWSRPDLSSPR